MGRTGCALASMVHGGLLASCVLLWLMGLAYDVPAVRLRDVPYGDVLSESINNSILLAIG